MKNRTVLSALLAAGFLFPSSARAERFEELVIEGEVQKPEVTVVITRENLNKSMQLAKLERSFLDLIIKSVDKAPF
jgi:hypothetical protein